MESLPQPPTQQPLLDSSTEAKQPSSEEFASPIKSQQNPSICETADKTEQRAIKTEGCLESAVSIENIEENLEKYFDEYAVLDGKPSEKKAEGLATPMQGLDDVRSNNEAKSESEDREIDEEELYRYSQLSNKLNSALSRIEQSKFLGTKSSPRGNFAATYERFELFEKKRRDAIEQKAKEVEEEKLKQLKLKPKLNEYSINLSKQNAPIYERYDRLLQTKERKLEEEREKKKKQEEQQFEEYLRVFESKNQKPDKFRSPEDFYSELVRWKQRAQQKVEEKKETDKKKEVEGATFKPIINERSKKLLEKKGRQPIYDRQPKPPKVLVEEYSFHPKINKKVLKS